LIFSKFIFRWKCEAPFEIKNICDRPNMEDLLTKIDANLIGRNNIDDVKKIDDKENMAFDENFMEMKTVIFILKNFKTIILNLKDIKYPRENSNDNSIKIKIENDNIDFYFKFFTEICVSPTIFSIYKTLYFSDKIIPNMKYFIYILILNFLNNFHFLCNELIKELNSNYNMKKDKTFKKMNIENLESKNLIQYFNHLRNSSQEDAKKINSPEFKLELNYKILIREYFEKYIIIFNDVKPILLKNDIGQFVTNRQELKIKCEEDEFKKALKTVYINYVESKENFSNSAVAEIFDEDE